MPIILAPASPLGSAASIGIGAGVAEQNAKMFPTLAALYGHIASLRAGGGGGGGGRGGGGGGGIQVLPRDDGGALYQVEAQANREERSQEQARLLGQPDYVMGHIRERENFQLQQQQSAQQVRQQELARLNPQAPPEPPPPQWGQAEQNALTKATQAVAGLKDDVEKGQLGEETGKMVIAPYQDKIDALTQQQEAYQKYQQNKQFQQASQAQAQKRALIDTDIRHAAQSGYRDVPDLPTPVIDIDHNGKKYMVNEVPYKAAEKAQSEARAHNSKMDLEKVKAQAKDPVIEQKLEHEARREYLDHYDKIEKDERAYEDKFLKDAQPGDKRRPMTPEELAGNVALRMKARGLPGTLQEATDQHKASRGQSVQPQIGGSKEVLKTADPEILGSLQVHVAAMPRTEQGVPDLNKSSPEQLDQLLGYYKNYKAIGVSEAVAAKWVQAITVAKANRAAPSDFEHAPPTTNRFARGASNIVNATPEVANRLGAGAARIASDADLGRIGRGFERTGIPEAAADVGSDVGFLGETAGGAARQAGAVVGSVVDRIERGGANTYDVFKRWLGK